MREIGALYRHNNKKPALFEAGFFMAEFRGQFT